MSRLIDDNNPNHRSDPEIEGMFADLHSHCEGQSIMDFVSSLEEWFLEKGWLTLKQFEALKKVHHNAMIRDWNMDDPNDEDPESDDWGGWGGWGGDI